MWWQFVDDVVDVFGCLLVLPPSVVRPSGCLSVSEEADVVVRLQMSVQFSVWMNNICKAIDVN